jgi:DNA polymerase-3 subunit gamma/tau
MLSRVMRAVAAQRPAEALAVVDDLAMRGHELRNFCRDLMAHLRDLLVVKVAGEGPALADATESERRELAAAAADFSESDLVRFFHSLTETEKALRESAHPRYQLEIGLVKLVEMRRLAPLGRIVERLNALEEAVRTGRAPAATPGAETPPAAPASGGQTRRGGAAGGSNPASLSPSAATEVAPATPSSEASAPPPTAQAATPAPVSEAAPPVAPPARPAPTDAEPPKAFGAGRPAASAASKLKLVPPPPGASASEAAPGTQSEAPPFPLGDEGAAEVFRAQTAPPPSRAVEPEPPAEPEPTDTAGRVKRGLEERNKPLLATLIDEARRVYVEGDEVRVEFTPDKKHLCDTLRKNMKLLHEVCCEAVGRPVGVQVCVGSSGGEGEDAFAREDEDRREQRRLRELAAENPLVKMVLKQFRGEIVEVRRADAAQQEPAPQAPPTPAPDGPIRPNRPGDARV